MTPTPQQIRSMVIDAGFNWVPYTNEVYPPSDPINDAITRLVTLALERFGQTAVVAQALKTTVIVARRALPSGRYSYTVESDIPMPVGTRLYTHPIPAEVREPLKNGQVEDCFKQWGNEPMDEEWESLGATDQMRRTFFEAFRLAEAAHGITGGKA